MRKRRTNILAPILLLLTFITGQVIAFAHNHNTETSGVSYALKKHKSAALDTKCQICSQNGHVQLFLQTQQLFFYTFSSIHSYISANAIYQSVALLLSGNRGPPATFLF